MTRTERWTAVTHANPWAVAALCTSLAFGAAAPFALADEQAPAQAQEASAQAAAEVESLLGDQLTLEDVQGLNGGNAVVHASDGVVTFIGGTCTPDKVLDADDAAEVVRATTALLGGDGSTQFEPWRTLNDVAGNTYYVFQQMHCYRTVSGGAVKVVTDPDGTMIALIGCVESEIPETEPFEAISAVRAEQIVLGRSSLPGLRGLAIVDDATERIVLPEVLKIDPFSEEEKEESRYVWAVYTTNPAGEEGRGYLAHYVTMDGLYLYNLPVRAPGDDAGASGFPAAYTFEHMEPVEHTETVTLVDGTEQELTVTVMRDSRTGTYYLGDVERKIAVADYYEIVYNDGNVVIESSEDGLDWDDNALLAFYNYGRAWDYYDEIGWPGGDGLATPTLILDGFCDKNKVPVDNAGYFGMYMGWQMFASSSANNLSECLDVIAHEFTHSVTDSTTTYNPYVNDSGAINEAISDIQGNICETMADEGLGLEVDEDWLLGEDSGYSIRSMGSPHLYDQPEYSWDVYYQPTVASPTDANDRGGVHSNSSLLNIIAYKLIFEGGMSWDEARAFWFAVDCAIVPESDFQQLAVLLPWMLETQGMGEYLPSLESAIASVQLGQDDIPDVFDDEHALLTLTLPDDEFFMDDNWILSVTVVNPERLEASIQEIVEYTASPEYLQAEELGDEESLAVVDDRVNEILTRGIDVALYAGTGSTGEGGGVIRMVCRPGTSALPTLMHLETDGDAVDYETMVFAVLINGRWYDMTSVALQAMAMTDEYMDVEVEPDQAVLDAVRSDLWSSLLSARSTEDVANLFVFEIPSAGVYELPTDGLEALVARAPVENGEEKSGEDR